MKNHSEATIESRAKINQTVANQKPVQQVDVSASTSMVLAGLGGGSGAQPSKQGKYSEKIETALGQLGLALVGTGGKSARAGAGGALQLAFLDNTTLAQIGDAHVHVGTGGGLNVTAIENVVHVVGITIGGAGAGTFALGGSVTSGILVNTTKAYVRDGKTTLTGSLGISAVDGGKMLLVGGGIAGAGTAAVGLGNASVVTKNVTQAYIDKNTDVTAWGDGSGVAAFTGEKDGIIGKARTEMIHGVSVTAVSFEEFLIVGAGGAGAGTVGIAGSASVNVLNQTTRAYIDTGAKVNFTNTNADLHQDVVVRASDQTKIIGVGGAIAGGGEVGIGAGVDVGVINKTTEAYVAPKTHVNANQNIRVEALSNEEFVSVAASIAGGGSVSIAGSVSVYVLNVTTRAFVDNAESVADGATLAAEGNVVVTAHEQTKAPMIPGNIGGSGVTSVGVAAAVPILIKDTEAFIGKNAGVEAKAKRDAVNVPSGEFTISFVTDTTEHAFPKGQNGGTVTGTQNIDVGAPGASLKNLAASGGDEGGKDEDDESLTKQRVATPVLRPIKGLAVTASNHDGVLTVGDSGAGSGTVTVNVGGVVQVAVINTQAHIDDGAKINQDQTGAGAEQDVLVAAGNDYWRLGVAAALGISGAVSVSPAVDVTVATFDTPSFIADGADVKAKRDLSVLASAKEDVLSIAGGAALSGTVGVAGSATVNVIDSTTRAYIGSNATTDETGAKARAGGNVLVKATDDSDLDAISGTLGLGIGGAGVGVSAGVMHVTKDTQAFVGNYAKVNALGGGSNSLVVYSGEKGSDDVKATESIKGLAVQALASEDVLNLGIAGGAGTVGVGGGVAVDIVHSNTKAFIDNDAKVTRIARRRMRLRV